MRRQCDSGLWVGPLVVALSIGASRGIAATTARLERRCYAAVGRASATCLTDYTGTVRRCRDAADAACEEALRIADGPLATIVAALEAPIREKCTDASAERISLSLGVDRHVHFRGTFTDSRIRAILPLDASVREFMPDVPALYSTIIVPTLLLGGSYSDFLAPLLQQAFDGLPSGSGVVGYGNFLRAVHPSFGDQCEVPEVLRGVSAACEPEALPWRHVRHIESYLALNFFDASLAGDADALARLDPAALADVEDLAYQRR